MKKAEERSASRCDTRCGFRADVVRYVFKAGTGKVRCSCLFSERKGKRTMFNKNDKKMRTVSIVIVVLICASMVIGTAAAGLSAFLH